MKRKLMNAYRIFLLLFSYPRRLADAVNRAANLEEFDELLEAEWNT